MLKIPFVLILLTNLCLLSSAARADNTIIDKVMKEQADRIPVEAMKKAFDFYTDHADQVTNKNYVTIVDFNRPSTEKRMHIINMQTGEVEAPLRRPTAKIRGTITPRSFPTRPGRFKVR